MKLNKLLTIWPPFEFQPLGGGPLRRYRVTDPTALRRYAETVTARLRRQSATKGGPLRRY